MLQRKPFLMIRVEADSVLESCEANKAEEGKKMDTFTVREQAKGTTDPVVCGAPFCIEKEDAESGRNGCSRAQARVTTRSSSLQTLVFGRS